METSNSSIYRRIVSSTAIFGGAQMLNALTNVIRAKLVAILLRSEGLGVSSVINNAANGLQQLALMGLNVAAVPDISKAHTEGDRQVLLHTVTIVRRLILVASVLGVVVTVALSPLLSSVSFATSQYTHAFLLLSVAVFFNVMATGELAILQGMRRYKLLALCSVVPPLCGLLLSVPIYYFWRVQGIVPALVVVNVVYFCVVRWASYRRKRTEAAPHISMADVWRQGRGILQFGFVMTVGMLAGTLTSYALTVFITRHGGLGDMGFYQAAGSITTQYVGLIFTAMAADYFPHLSQLLKNGTSEAFRFVNQQTEVILLIMSPLIMILILSAPLAIRLLLTQEFLPTERLVRFLGMAGIFKALCFPMDYIAYAKGDSRFIFWVETVWGCAKTLTIMTVFYYFLGLDGLGYGALVTAVIDVLVCLIVIPWRYGFRLAPATLRLTVVMVGLALCCLAASFLPDACWRYPAMGLMATLGTVYSLRQLDRRVNLRTALARFRQKWGRRNG